MPTGSKGRILKEDVLNFINKKEAFLSDNEVKSNNTMNSINLQNNIELNQEIKVSKSEIQSQDKVIKITGFQKAMTKTMTQATSIPTFLFTDEYNVDALVKLRKEMNETIKAKTDKISYMPFLIKAVSLSLVQYPHLNSTVNTATGSDNLIYEYTLKGDHNISIAIDGPEGLVVPNIKRVQTKSISQIQNELHALREKTEKRKLTSEDLKDGTFTLSNIGNNLNYFF